MNDSRNGFSQLALVGTFFIVLFILSAIGFWVKQVALTRSKRTPLQRVSQTKNQNAPTPVVTIPESFPKDIPIYTGSTPTSSLSDVALGAGMEAWLSLETADSIEMVMSFYKKLLAGKGWVISSTQNTPLGTMLTVMKGGKRATVSVESSGEQKKTTILIIIERLPVETPTT